MSWYSNIASRVNSSVSSLQRTVFNSEADGDTQDDTYVCRVLRQHYTEKGAGFPQWLPPDPKAPQPVAAPQQSALANSRYGAAAAGGPQQPGASGLSSLWDKNRGAGGAASPTAAAAGVNSRNPFAQRNAVTPDPGGVQARPLPSQRAGSYQAAGAGGGAPGGSVQDRLRSKLGSGARTVSPGSGSSPFSPPPQSSGGGSGDYDPYRSGSYGGGGGGGGYGDAGAGAGAPAGRYGGGGGGGLPSGPRRMGGLPSGPRMR